MEPEPTARKRKGRTPRWVLMGRRFHDQALVDLESARENLRPRRFHNAVYFSEQAAEKALKAAHWHLLAEEPRWGHEMPPLAASVADLVGGVPEKVADAIGEIEAELERSRYPSSDATEPIPAEAVSEKDARTAVERAETVIRWAESLLQLRSGRPKRRKS